MQSATRLAIALAFLVGLKSLCAAEDPFTLSLLMPDSLTGWDYGQQPIVGWTIESGKLSGAIHSTPLLAGWTLGERFDLRFGWSASPAGKLRFAFADAAGGGRFDLLVGEGDSCGAVFHNNKLLTAGGAVARSEAGHAAVLRRDGGMWQLFVDEKPVAAAQVPGQSRLGLTLSVAEGTATIEDLRLDEPVGRSMFNGVDLTGWWTPRNLKSWPIVGGEIVCINRSRDYLRSEQEYANFTFSCEYQMQRGGNSGIGIRTARNAWPSGDGIELQLLDEPPAAPLSRSSTMGLYGNVESLARADRSETWNRLVVKAEGYIISAWVNGTLTQHVNTARLPELKHRPLSGWIGFQDHGAWLRVRNVNVLEHPQGLGLAAWYAPRVEDGSQLVLDRLMNPERLAIADGTRSQTTRVRSEGAEELLLADLTGPGAVVEIEATNLSGQIACYFEGETAPRIDCPLAELAAHLPEVAARPGSWGTFLGFERGLKIVLRGATAGNEYRIAHVSFSRNPVQSCRDAKRSIARGMLPAISYRLGQMESGRVREADPAPRASSEKRSIEPGATAPLVQLEGAGTVQWWHLDAPRSVLDNDDLWLEITIDGEAQPAVSAPARYLFPGLKGGAAYHNFVVTHNQGFTNRLAIPYANGLSIVAVNRGASPLAEIGFSLSYVAETKPGETKSRMRLRGTWQSPSDANPWLVRQAGRGRLVAIVCQQPPSPADEVELGVDGSVQAGEGATRLGRWLMLPENNEDVLGHFQGRQAGLVWRYFLLAPVDFDASIELRALGGPPPGGRLALCYVAP